MKTINLNIELAVEDGTYVACIGEENSSGYTCKGATVEECTKQIADYCAGCFVDSL